MHFTHTRAVKAHCSCDVIYLSESEALKIQRKLVGLACKQGCEIGATRRGNRLSRRLYGRADASVEDHRARASWSLRRLHRHRRHCVESAKRNGRALVPICQYWDERHRFPCLPSPPLACLHAGSCCRLVVARHHCSPGRLAVPWAATDAVCDTVAGAARAGEADPAATSL